MNENMISENITWLAVTTADKASEVRNNPQTTHG